MRATWAKAKALAERLATNLANGQAAMNAFTEADRAGWKSCIELAAGRPPQHLIAAYLEFRTGLPEGVTDAEVKQFFLDNRPRGVSSKSCPEVIDELIARKQKDEPAGSRWIDDLDSRLGRFKKHYAAPLSQLRAPAINAWLQSLPVGARSRNNYRTALLALVAYAKANNYLARTWSEMELVPKAKEKAIEVKLFTPEHMAALLAHCRPNLQPFMALQAFAGIRHEELQKMDWRHIRLDQRLVYVPAEAAKVGTPKRLVPIQDNLLAWLKRHHKRNGSICELSNIANALRRTAKRARVTWKRNSLRKSFISYRLAKVHDIGKVAQEAGNSPSMIKKHYELPIPEDESDRWFALQPPADGVVDLWEWAESNKRSAAK
ncbi:MAG: tyrosine-type recombinase/integrase [Patescibacteria group bacterium]|nr:tyrosine-type recombinase/integrase [Patescibacteria group bacterium]